MKCAITELQPDVGCSCISQWAGDAAIVEIGHIEHSRINHRISRGGVVASEKKCARINRRSSRVGVVASEKQCATAIFGKAVTSTRFPNHTTDSQVARID